MAPETLTKERGHNEEPSRPVLYGTPRVGCGGVSEVFWGDREGVLKGLSNDFPGD
jgi:hypothetical protein